jgi:hypothetical protein
MALLKSLVSRGRLPASRVKDIRTSLSKLADAVGSDIDDLDLTAVESTYPESLHTYFAEHTPDASPSTKRNTAQNLKQFYRLLHETGVLQTTPPPMMKRFTRRSLRIERRKNSPYRRRTSAVMPPYQRRPEQWPAAIREPWERYCASRTFDIRATTLDLYRRQITPYISYGLAFDQPPISTWDDLFDSARLVRFITWHAGRVGAGRISPTGFSAARLVTEIAKSQQRPEVPALQALMRKLPTVEPFHNKQAPYHTISMAELEAVGLRLLAEAHRPLVPHAKYGAKRPGLHLVANHQTALIIRLMWRVPLRNRSIREMALGNNLFQDAQGLWRLRYVGDELKVSERGGRINTFEIPWPEELVDHLEEYLRDFRPKLPNADTSPLVFLTNRGRPLTVTTLYWRLTETVSCYLGKRLYPHLLRTLWVDQYLLSSGGDVSTAAYMLNDTVATMLQRYHELRGESHVQKAYNFNQRILDNGGKRTSP